MTRGPCIACGSDRPDVCDMLGHSRSTEYKATGMQLRVPPWERGMSPAKWLATVRIERETARPVVAVPGRLAL